MHDLHSLQDRELRVMRAHVSQVAYICGGSRLVDGGMCKYTCVLLASGRLALTVCRLLLPRPISFYFLLRVLSLHSLLFPPSLRPSLPAVSSLPSFLPSSQNQHAENKEMQRQLASLHHLILQVG
jgi:hypothetical protein